jgi:hypothetical protein
MLSKCANPACAARFRYLHEGRIFNIEIAALPADHRSRLFPKIEHFWLCGQCAQFLKVAQDNGIVITRSLHLELSEGTPEDEPEEEPSLA